MAVQQATKAGASTSITLKGSAEMVREFFSYGVNSILYQRGIYPESDFTRVSKYGLTMLVNTNDKITSFLQEILQRMGTWLERGELDKVVVVISGVETGKTLERWTFDVQMDDSFDHDAKTTKAKGKTEAEAVKGIQAVIRQITASVTCLPLLEERCAFDMLLYAKNSVEIPEKWEESDAKIIPNQTQIHLRSFSTNIHTVDASVAYANQEAL